jgi:hypothetical protein
VVRVQRTVVIDCHIEDVFDHLARRVAAASSDVRCDPPHRVEWRAGDGIEVMYELEPVWTATRVTRRDAGELGALRTIARRRDVVRQLRALKHELEHGRRPSS